MKIRSTLLVLLVSAGVSFADDHYEDLPYLPEIVADLGVRDQLEPYGFCVSNFMSTMYRTEYQVLKSEWAAERMDRCFTNIIKEQRANYKPRSNDDVYKDDYTPCLKVDDVHKRALCFATALREKVAKIQRELEVYESKFGLWEIETITDRMTDEEMIIASLESAVEGGFTATLKVYCDVQTPRQEIKVDAHFDDTHNAYLIHNIEQFAGTYSVDLNSRFDKEDLRESSWSEEEADTGGYNLRADGDWFIGNVEKSERYLLQVENSVYEFDVRKASAAFEPLKEKCSVPR